MENDAELVRADVTSARIPESTPYEQSSLGPSGSSRCPVLRWEEKNDALRHALFLNKPAFIDDRRLGDRGRIPREGR